MTIAIDDEIRGAFSGLQLLITARIRQEQLRDQLTGLANGSALMETIRDRLQKRSDFWIAFVEVDRFKSVNDRFGYENADALLRKIAEMLHTMCICFPGATQAFRAHGDEFYLMGEPAAGDRDASLVGAAERALDLVRQNISVIKVPVEGSSVMSCTVSIGWLSTADIKDTKTDRRVVEYLENAVAEAKRARDKVVRYSSAMQRYETISLRADCAACGCKFSFDIPRAKNLKDKKAACPNCFAEVERPEAPQCIPMVEAETV